MRQDSSSQPEIIVRREGGIVRLILNRPNRRNAITPGMWLKLRDIFTEIGETEADRVLVVEGAGGAFCSGADLKERHTGPADPLAFLRRMGRAALMLHQLPIPTIAKVDGPAVGAGLNLALGCDLVVASTRSTFSEIFTKRALTVDFGGSWLLPRLIGLHRAKELVFFGEMLTACEARDIGLVNRVVDEGRLEETVADWASLLCDGPGRALSMSKALLNRSMSMSMETALEAEAHCQAVNSGSDAAVAAAAAFIR